MSLGRHVRRRLRRVGAAGALALGTVGAAFAPRALRNVDAFRVRRVEVVGTRYTEPYAVVRAAGLGAGGSVFDDPDAWRSGVLTLPLVEEVRVRRKLPSTVTVEVREVEPLALVAAEVLRPVDRGGRLLEIEPAGSVLNLPILLGADVARGRVTGAGARALDVLAALHGRAPELAEKVSEIQVRPGFLRVVFRDEAVEALLPLEPTLTQVTQLRLAYADLAARGELGKARRIDVRFRDQVVVSFPSTPVS